MKVLHVIPGLDLDRGGPSRAVLDLCDSVADYDLRITIATTAPRGGSKTRRVGRVDVREFETTFTPYSCSSGLRAFLGRTVSEFDLVHVHEMFTFPSTVAAWQARRARVPYVLTPHGALMRWGLRNRRPLLKKVSIRLNERRVFYNAASVHFTSLREREETELVMRTRRACVIPFGMAVPARVPDPELFRQAHPSLGERPYILVLGRLDPIKGIELVLDAFGHLRRAGRQIALVVAGSGPDAYVAQLKKRALSLGLECGTAFVGFLGQEQKLSALAGALCLAQASQSESFGMSMIEALAVGTPVITTDRVALAAEIGGCRAGAIVSPEADLLAAAIERYLDHPQRRTADGNRGMALVKARFALERTSNEVVELYRAVLSEPHWV